MEVHNLLRSNFANYPHILKILYLCAGMFCLVFYEKTHIVNVYLFVFK
jgi:hypothetical protein